MLNLLYCEILKLKNSKMVFVSFLGVLATPFMIFIEAVQSYFKYPNRNISLDTIFNNSTIYIMLLTNMMIYVVITAYIFSREYSDGTLKTILPIPIKRYKLITIKFLILLIWIMVLTIFTWFLVFFLSLIYKLLFRLEGFTLLVSLKWLLKYIFGGLLIFITISPFAFISIKSKGIFVPMIVSAVAVLGSAALSNQDIGALYPYTINLFIIQEKLTSIGYPIMISLLIVLVLSIIGFSMTYIYFEGEDLK